MKNIVFIFILLKSFVIFSKDSTKILFSPYIDLGHLFNQSLQLGTIVETKKIPLQLGVGLLGTAGTFNQNNERNLKEFNSKYFDHKADKINGLGYNVALRYLEDKFKGISLIQSLGFQSMYLKMKFFENFYIENGPIIVHRLSQNSGKINQNKIYYQFSIQSQTRFFIELGSSISYNFSKINPIITEFRNYDKTLWDFGHNGIGANVSVKFGYRINKNYK